MVEGVTEQKFLIDEWLFDYIDHDDRANYGAAGNLIAVENASPVEVVKITDKKYKIEGRCGECLIEDKPTYKEKLDKIKKICDKASTKITFVSNGRDYIEVKDAQKLALKILKIIGE